MSYGLTPYEFVQQVYYAQEKVILDFWPDDDKYKEVLTEANLVLQELQGAEDWSWLRRRLILGQVDRIPGHSGIPEFELPTWVYKLSTLHDDNLRLYATHGRCGRKCNCSDCQDGRCLDEHNYIEIPITSLGRLNGRTLREYAGPSTNVRDTSLGAVLVGGNTLTFTRPLSYHERVGRVAVCDVQARLPLIHICSDKCPRDEDGKCLLIEDRILTEIPDPNYVVMRTAALHAEGSPPAQGRIQSLVDNAQKLLSAMRQNDASATDADFLDWTPVGVVNVM